MAVDFGNVTLPGPGPMGPYFATVGSPAMELTDWDTIIAVMGHLVGFCNARYNRPGWAIRYSNIAVVVAPLDSEFWRQWWSAEPRLELNDSNTYDLSTLH